MRAIVQRVSRASVSINNTIHSEIDTGFVVFIAITHNDNEEVMKWMCNKLINLRIFPDEENKMNKSVLDCNGGILLISNFTLYGDVNKGFRPSFIKAAPPEIAEPLYQSMIDYIRNIYPIKIATGVFGAKMDIELVNDGPVTIFIEK
ncbi:MAG: D-aminoacyl-tRNA deacylase [FCB group bacterium]|jgi:D-tyrosyl-tRNA(Tyr) deacylase